MSLKTSSPGTIFYLIIFYIHIFLGMHLLIGHMSWQLVIFQISSTLKIDPSAWQKDFVVHDLHDSS